MPEVEHDSDQRDLSRFETELIRRKAATLVRGGVVPRSDLEDARQELTLALLTAHAKVEVRAASRDGLAVSVLSNAASNLIRQRSASKRTSPGTLSLDTMIAHDNEPIDARHDTRPWERFVDLAVDAKALLASLPHDLALLAEALKARTVTELARELGVPRTTLYGPLAKLRGLFTAAGLKKYLPQSSDSLEANGVLE